MELGSKVRVKSSRHPDVIVNTEGVIDGPVEDGFGVTITGHWVVAGNDRGLSLPDTKTVWYPGEELELLDGSPVPATIHRQEEIT